MCSLLLVFTCHYKTLPTQSELTTVYNLICGIETETLIRLIVTDVSYLSQSIEK